MKLAVLDELVAARAAKQAVVLATWLDGSEQRLLSTLDAPAELGPSIEDALRLDRATVIETTRGGVFVEPHNPPLRLVIVGAVHVAESLATIAELAGFAVTIVDPRRAWATAERFPGRSLVLAWPDRALAELAPDARTAIVTLTHDPKLDDPALVVALASRAFYIGCLGSPKTHAARIERLTALGCSKLGRLHGPVGLPIGARSPTEIAIAILAQIIAELRRRA